MKKESTQNSHMSLHFGRNEKASLKLLKQDSRTHLGTTGLEKFVGQKKARLLRTFQAAHMRTQSPWPGRPRPQAIPRRLRLASGRHDAAGGDGAVSQLRHVTLARA